MVGATAYMRKTGKSDFSTIVQPYVEPPSEANVFNVQRLHQLTNEQDKALFYLTFPSFKEGAVEESG
jgi:hypothetical protein